jgi:hypothetical protein
VGGDEVTEGLAALSAGGGGLAFDGIAACNTSRSRAAQALVPSAATAAFASR